MRAVVLFLFIFSLSLAVSAQDEEDSWDPVDSTTTHHGLAIELFLGKKFYQNSFYDQLNSLSKPNLQDPVTFVGLGYNGGFVVSRNKHYSGHLAFLYVIPQKISLDTNGHGKISGFVFSVSVVGWNLLKQKRDVELNLSFGANVGRIRILGEDQLKQRNPILAPMVALSPSFYLGKLKLTLNLQYDYDVSNKEWLPMLFNKVERVPLTSFNQSGVSAFLCLGMNIN